MTLGKDCYILSMAVMGPTDVASARAVVNEVVRQIGMAPIFEPAVYQYEENIGIIYIQPIFESFVAYDAWPRHGGGYITVLSCREFEADIAMQVVEAQGFTIVDHDFHSLTLRPKPRLKK